MQGLEITGGIQPGVFCLNQLWFESVEMSFNLNVAKPKNLFVNGVNASDF